MTSNLESKLKVDMKLKCKDLIYIAISVPVSLIVFVLGSFYSRATNNNGKSETNCDDLTPIRKIKLHFSFF